MLMSFPPATEMFQFAGFASPSYGLTGGYPLPGGLPHSEIRGSTGARPSPRLFAACHVLHRLSVPRHPPDALLVQPCPRPAPSPRARAVRRGPDVRCQMADVRRSRARPRRPRFPTGSRPLFDLRRPVVRSAGAAAPTAHHCTRSIKGQMPRVHTHARARGAHPVPIKEHDAHHHLAAAARLRTPTVTTSPARCQISDVGRQMSDQKVANPAMKPELSTRRRTAVLRKVSQDASADQRQGQPASASSSRRR
jgi:hypothetical protein